MPVMPVTQQDQCKGGMTKRRALARLMVRRPLKLLWGGVICLQ